MTSKGVRK